MKVRAAVLGSVAMVALFTMPGVGVAAAEGSTKTSTEKIEGAGISIAYPASWRIITTTVANDDVGRITTQFAVVAPGRDGTLVIVQTIPLTDDERTDRSDKAFKAYRDHLRASAKKGYEVLRVTKQKVGSSVAYRTDLGLDRGKARAFRQGGLTFEWSSALGRKNVVVTVYASLDEEGRAVTDRILGSVKRL